MDFESVRLGQHLKIVDDTYEVIFSKGEATFIDEKVIDYLCIGLHWDRSASIGPTHELEVYPDGQLILVKLGANHMRIRVFKEDIKLLENKE